MRAKIHHLFAAIVIKLNLKQRGCSCPCRQNCTVEDGLRRRRGKRNRRRNGQASNLANALRMLNELLVRESCVA